MNNNKHETLLHHLINQIASDEAFIKDAVVEQIKTRQRKPLQTKSDRETMRRLRIQNKKMLEQVKSLREKFRETNAEKNFLTKTLAEVTKTNDLLSQALGSCNQCWGNNTLCEQCAGNGIPGWRQINKRLFNSYVLPCLEKLYGLNN